MMLNMCIGYTILDDYFISKMHTPFIYLPFWHVAKNSRTQKKQICHSSIDRQNNEKEEIQ